MWSGAPQWASWALQPQHYQNMRPEEVDWAELAKQWIQMKDDDPADVPQQQHQQQQQQQQQVTHQPTPVPPVGGEAPTTVGGEMDMEIEDDKEMPANGDQTHQNGEMWSGGWSSSSTGTGASGSWSSGWGWGWPMDSSSYSSTSNTTQGPASATQQHIYPTAADHNKDVSQQPYATTYPTGYGWPMVGGDMSQQGTGGDYNSANKNQDRRRQPQSRDSQRVLEPEKEADFQLDAAQRKKLPIWIREGLEKMEREKQKKLERERMMNEKEEMLRRKREEEARARQILEEDIANDGVARIPRKSKFESDSEGEGHSRSGSPESSTPGLGSMAARKRRSRFDAVPNTTRLQNKPVSDGPGLEDEDDDEEDGDQDGGDDDNAEPMPATESLNLKTEEEKLQEMMTKLRRWMTEILLDVTTDMMKEVAGEVINRARMRAPPVQVKKSSGALASLSGTIGLGIYSDSESDGEASVGAGGDGVAGETDSDEELRETIRRKRKTFMTTERYIMQKLNKEEMAERRQQGGESEDSEREENDLEGKGSDEGEEGDGERDGVGERLGLGMKETESRGGKGLHNKDFNHSSATAENQELKQSKTGIKHMKFVPPQDPLVDSTQPDQEEPNGSQDDDSMDSKLSEGSVDSEADSKSSGSADSSEATRTKRKKAKKDKKKSLKRSRDESEDRNRRSHSRSKDRDDKREKKKKKHRSSYSRSHSSDRYSSRRSRSRSRENYRRRKTDRSDSDDRISHRSRDRSRSYDRLARDKHRSRSRDRRRSRSRDRERRKYRERSEESSRSYRHRSRSRGRERVGRRHYRDMSEESRSGRSSRRRSYSRSRSKSKGYSHKKDRYHSRSRSRSHSDHRKSKKHRRRSSRRSRDRSPSIPFKKARRRSSRSLS